MSTSRPAHVRVHYQRDGAPAFMTGYLPGPPHRDGLIELVINPAAADDPSVCRWTTRTADVTRVEILDAGHQPTVMDHFLAAVTLTPREQIILDVLRAHGGPVQHCDVPDIVRYHAGHDHLEPGTILRVVQSLKHKGRVTLAKSAGLASGVVHLT